MCELLLQSLGDKCLAALEARAHARAQTNTATSANKALPMARSVIEVRTSLTSMFERYLDEHVIQTKLQPLEAASALLSCAPEELEALLRLHHLETREIEEQRREVEDLDEALEETLPLLE